MVTVLSGDLTELFRRSTPPPHKPPMKPFLPRRPLHRPPAPSANRFSPPTNLATPPTNLFAPPFAVGLQLAHEDLGDRVTAPSSPSASPTFVRAIMHRPVSARCFVATVRYDAPSAQIAAACAVPEDDVEQVWLAGVRDPAVHHPRVPAPDRHAMRYLPPSMAEDLAARGVSEERDVHMPECGLDRGQFADLFAGEAAVDEKVLEFGNALIGRLEALAGTAKPVERYRGRSRRRNTAGRHAMSMNAGSMNASNSDSCSSAGMVDSSGSCSAGTERRCGFSEKGSHIDVEVLCQGLAICKTGGGLYRTARSSSWMVAEEEVKEKKYYYEVVVVEDGNSGGICVGVADESLALNKLVGSNGRSCGMHSSGQIVSSGGEFRDFGREFKRGDRVGCMVTVRSRRYAAEDDVMSDGGSAGCDVVELGYWINGEWQGCVNEALWEGAPDSKRKLFAAVSLYKKGSKAVIQCCEKDWTTPRETLCSGGGKVEAVCSGRLGSGGSCSR